ncbi:glycosyl transferase, partial [Rhodovulum visakhapatnamense]|nr:glycosyl transferase [Rhodovulum visakhapatnamense]
DRLKPLIDLWRAYAEGAAIPDPASLPGPAAP